MPRIKKKIQVGLDKETYENFIEYKSNNGINQDSEAGHKLIEFALTILRENNDSNAISNRALLEHLLLQLNKCVFFSRENLARVINVSDIENRRDTFNKTCASANQNAKDGTTNILTGTRKLI